MATILASGVGWAPPVQAQEGGWIELGAGAGWGQLTCDICSDTRTSGVDLRFGVGTQLRPRFGLGMETSGWVTSSDPARQVIGTVVVVARIHPGSGPFRVQAGLGTGHYRGIESGDADDLSLTALSAQLGLSGEARLGRRFVLEPTVSASFGAFGSLQRGDREVWDRAGFNLIRLGVVISRRGGIVGG